MSQNPPEYVTKLLGNPEAFSGANHIMAIISLIFGGSFSGIAIMLIAHQLGGLWGTYLAILGGGCIGIALRKKRNSAYLAAWIVAGLGGILAWFALQSLAVLASAGISGTDNSRSAYVYAQGYIIFGILWFLLGVPHRAFKYQIDQAGKGQAQHILLGLLTSVASILTASFILLLHFGGGPLQKVDIKALLAGTVPAVFLVSPWYRSVAKACWKHGVPGVFSVKPLKRGWSAAAKEVHDAQFIYAWIQAKEYRDSKIGVKKGAGHSPSDPTTVESKSPLQRHISSGSKSIADDANHSSVSPSARRSGGKRAPSLRKPSQHKRRRNGR